MKLRQHLAITLAIALCVLGTFTTKAQSTLPSKLTITISSQGMTPASATVSAGIVHLKVENQTGQEQIKLRLSRQNGDLVRELVMPESAKEWHTELELKEGQYVISVSNSSLSCQITAQTPPQSEGVQRETRP